MCISLHIDSHVRLDAATLSDELQQRLKALATRANPVWRNIRAMGYGTGGVAPYLYSYQYDPDTGILSFKRGLLGDIIRTLKDCGVPYSIQDNRLRLPKVPMSCTIRLREYQVDPVKTMIRRQQTVGRGPAGSGKTETLLRVAAYFREPTLILVWQTEQQKTWLDRIPLYFDVEPGGIGGLFPEPHITPLTVGMSQSVFNRFDEIKDQFSVVICDEVQRAAAHVLNEIINNMPARIRLGASDDERRKDGLEFLIYDTFGPLSWSLEATQGQAPVSIFVVPTQFKTKARSWGKIIDELTTDEDRNALIVDLALEFSGQGHRTLIWSDRVDHCLDLAERIRPHTSVGLILGGNSDQASRTKEGLTDGSILVGVGTSVAEQSLNIPPLDRGIMTCGSADKKMFRFRQMRGRLARIFPGKESKLFYLWDHRVYMLSNKINNIERVYSIENKDVVDRVNENKKLRRKTRRKRHVKKD